MEPPVAFDAGSVREEKVKVLKAVRPIPENEVENYAVRGQYEGGWVWGEEVPGYREEEKVDPGSVTETFVALKVFVDNWRDRKSTRLNSSHANISYAVFCLKK